LTLVAIWWYGLKEAIKYEVVVFYQAFKDVSLWE